MSYQFGNLPLEMVAARFAADGPQPFSVEFLIDLAGQIAAGGRQERITEAPEEEFDDPFHILRQPFQIPFRIEKERGVAIVVSSLGVAVFWKVGAGTHEYPRYEGLRAATEEFLADVRLVIPNGLQFRSCELEYAVRAPLNKGEREGVAWAIGREYRPSPAPPAVVRGFNATYSFGSVDYALSCGQTDAEPDTLVLDTSGHVRALNKRDPLDVLDTIHSTMIKEFPKMLTQEAKAKWQYEAR